MSNQKIENLSLKDKSQDQLTYSNATDIFIIKAYQKGNVIFSGLIKLEKNLFRIEIQKK
jgi:hypothetical protein